MNQNETAYLDEIRLSRELARAIEQEIACYGQVVPHSVYQAYLRLQALYQREIDAGVM